MRFARVPLEASRLHGLVQHGLAVSEACERGGIETAEQMERTLLVSGAANCGVEKGDIERRVVADQNGALAFELSQCLADRLENHVERIAFLDRTAEWMRRV